MFVVDTNVLVYAANASAPEHARCRQLVEGWRRGVLPWSVTWGILYEFLRIATHPRVFLDPWSIDHAGSLVVAGLASPGLTVLVETERHAGIVSELLRDTPGVSGNLLHDAHTVALMREHGARRIYTHDTDFHRFAFIEVIDPLRQSA
jgi:toxin-antitoxin system PIN domain toxin